MRTGAGKPSASRSRGDRRITDHRLAATESGSIVCTAQDITGERTTASTQHGEFYFLFEGEDESAFYTLDHEGYVTRWNDRVEDVLGGIRSKPVSGHISGHTFPETQPANSVQKSSPPGLPKPRRKSRQI